MNMLKRDRMVPNDSGTTTSPWMTTSVEVFDDMLPSELTTDVCVVGAGIVGMSAAYHLTGAGLQVVVIDDGPIGGGETSRTTAHLASALDDRFYRLERMHGPEGARLAAASHAAAIDRIEEIVRTHRIECDFRRVDGYLFAGKGGPADELERELDAARRAGLEVEALARAPITSFDTGPCLRFANQAQFHPIAYLRGLASVITERGGRIYSGVHARDVEPGKPSEVATDGHQRIFAGSVVIATNAPITSMVELPLRQAAYRTYVIAASIARDAVPPGLYWDTSDPYHYVRTAPRDDDDPGDDLLIVGGEDHKTGQDGDPAERWERLETWTRDRFPVNEVLHRWSGQVLEPADGLAFIGRSGGRDSRLFLATGDSGNGLTHGALAGMLLTDLITGQPNPYAALYDPDRSVTPGLGTLVREGLNATARYVDWLLGADVSSCEDIAPGHGAIVRDGVHMLAVYRDDAGVCHRRSAACPHLGGVVRWNPAEKSWDCPLHGSRFDALGKCIDGPANADLGPAPDPDRQA